MNQPPTTQQLADQIAKLTNVLSELVDWVKELDNRVSIVERQVNYLKVKADK